MKLASEFLSKIKAAQSMGALILGGQSSNPLNGIEAGTVVSVNVESFTTLQGTVSKDGANKGKLWIIPQAQGTVDGINGRINVSLSQRDVEALQNVEIETIQAVVSVVERQGLPNLTVANFLSVNQPEKANFQEQAIAQAAD